MTENAAASSEYGADALIVCDNLVRIYQVENIEVQALQGLDLLVDRGEMIAIVGQSGSGKSTLLNVLSGLDVPTAGSARVAGWDLLRMSHSDRLTYRRSVVGFVWQQTARNLFPYLTARENVMLPMALSGMGGRARARRAHELLATMSMDDRADRRPGQMSGGEQQRVAIAVALANSPEVLFADEPTGELDSATGDQVFEALRAANRELGTTVVVVTHDQAVSSQVQRTVAIRDGRTATEVVRRTHVDEAGLEQTVHEEYAVLDRAGRMQLPQDYRTTLGLRDRVRLELESDHVGVWNDRTPHRPPAAPLPPVAEAQEAPAPPAAEHHADASDAASAAQDSPVVETPSRPAMPHGSRVTADTSGDGATAEQPSSDGPRPSPRAKVPPDFDIAAARGEEAPYQPSRYAPPVSEDAPPVTPYDSEERDD